MKAIRFHQHGGPEVLRFEEAPTPTPGPGEVLVALRAAALNHLDLFVREGIPGVSLPHIGGADGAFNRGMQWQGLSLRMTLHHEPMPWIPSTYMPTLAGRLFYLKELAGPLIAECH